MTHIRWLPFRWEAERLGEREFPHAAMFVLAQLPTLDGLEGWFQFDLGAPTSVLYGRALTPQQRARVEAHLHAERKAIFNGQPTPLLQVPIMLGEGRIEPVVYLADFGDAERWHGHPVLGTIGGDWARGHVLGLDFPRQRLARLAAVPPAWERAGAWAPLRRTPYGHVVLQIGVDRAPRWAMFDTGSSLFGLLTDPEQWRALTDGQVTEVLTINAWGTPWKVQGSPARAAFDLAGQPLDVTLVHFVEGERERQFLVQHELVGILGNAPFLGGVLVLDFPGARAAFLPAEMVA